MLQRGFLELANGKNLEAPSQPWGSDKGCPFECAELPGEWVWDGLTGDRVTGSVLGAK